MKIAIYGKPYKNQLNTSIQNILDTAKKAGFEVVIYERFAKFLKDEGHIDKSFPTFSRKNVAIEAFQCLVSVGGDGTLLDTLTIVKDSGVPVIGLNAGRLGFITSVSIDEFEAILKDIKEEKITCDERTLLKVETKRKIFGDFPYALNELTILKKDSASMISIACHLNGEFLNTYWADGIIVATPTGSTAYSLSCGGPIIVPGSENAVITPIAPHNLNVRPLVISNDSELQLAADGRSEEFLISLDSRSRTIYPGEIVRISKAPFTFKLLRPNRHSFISTLRNKLAWGFDKRND
ncbi:MAG: NAD kinase [Cryomorphaceae bacterium]|nr:NAD kinase [Flavobacteriales bacterium]